ncbi:MAG: ABC transporter substrate-binding protein, partial [Solirubrobacterales bacterium]|nr:ABC transporter substrate-binding protein [Solirubrobacterales bacterium]
MRASALLTVAPILVLLLAACGAEAPDSPAPSPSPQRAPRAATLLLDFAPNAVHSRIYATTRRGDDLARGVRLRVRVPPSAADAVRLLLAGRADLAVLDIHDLALARERGRDVVGVLAIVQRPLAAVLAQPG